MFVKTRIYTTTMLNKFKRLIIQMLLWKARHRIFSWRSYSHWVENLHQDKKLFVPFTSKPFKRQENDVKIFTYYLTQFHAIPENDKAHGKGFTEWTNVASTIPHFVGHHQPKIPYDLGFYNLLMPGIMERQVEIAKTYGVYGFCFYYYWFSGKKVLEKPLEYWLSHKEIDFPYHFCWANENWSKLWDGGNSEVMLKQELKDSDAENFFYDILPYMKDPRYEKIDNKPMLMIYRPSMFPKEKFIKFVNVLQTLAKNNGFNGLYLMSSNHTKIEDDIETWGLQAEVEFPPHGIKVKSNKTIDRLIPATNFTIHMMDEFVKEKKYLTETTNKTFRCCFPSWDNTPRKAWSWGMCYLLKDEDFKTWLYDIIQWTKKNHSKNEQYVYINAWNEWAEGAILEPTTRFGYKYLDIIKEVLIISQNKTIL